MAPHLVYRTSPFLSVPTFYKCKSTLEHKYSLPQRFCLSPRYHTRRLYVKHAIGEMGRDRVDEVECYLELLSFLYLTWRKLPEREKEIIPKESDNELWPRVVNKHEEG